MQQEFEYVYQLYLSGSFSKAAAELFITQPALSIAIARIENQVGMPLFDRKRHPLKLTPAGEIYLETVKKARVMEQELNQKLNDLQSLSTGHICIGGSNYINSYILPTIIQKFCRVYPGITLELVEHSAARLAKMLEDYELDLTFSCNPEIIMEFEGCAVFQDHILLAIHCDLSEEQRLSAFELTAGDVAAGKHLRADCPSVPLSLFEKQEFILLKEGNNLYDRSLRMFEEAGYEPSVKLQLSQLTTSYHLAEQGVAAAFISDRMVRNGTGELRFFKIDSPYAERAFYILYPKRHYVSRAARMFCDFLCEGMR